MKNPGTLRTLIGPHGSGKTAKVLAAAARRLRKPTRDRVAVITLPQARNHVLARFAREQGGAPGFKVLHWQALYTEVLAETGGLQPPLDTLDRTALVGEALREVIGRTPGPGEASLYTRGIAELKRFGITPDQVPIPTRQGKPDGEAARLAEVYRHYEQLRSSRHYQDPDDRRREALERLAELESLPYATLIVDGFRELSPVEAAFLKAYAARGAEVIVTAPEGIPTLPASERLEKSSVALERYALPNVIEEARWVIARVKRLLLEGARPDEIVIVTPPALAGHYRHFAERLKIALADEHAESLADLDEGRLLIGQLALPEHPTADALRQISGLEPLAARLYALGVSGLEATRLVAKDLGLEEALEEALAGMEPEAGEDPEDWVRRMIKGDPELGASPWADEFMRAGFLAARFINGHDYDPARMREWWRALLGVLRPARRDAAAGVVFTSATRLGGRRFKHAFVAGAYAGAYLTGESEDYFLPDEPGVRLPWEAAFEAMGLPERLRNRVLPLWDELRGAGQVTTLSFPLAHAGGPLEPEVALLGARKEDIPLAEPAPRSEPRRGGSYGPPRIEAPLPFRHVDQLREMNKCGYRAFLRRVNLAEGDELPEWYSLLERLKDDPRDTEALAGLGFDPNEVGPDWHFLPEFRVVERAAGKREIPLRLHVVISGKEETEIVYVTPKEIRTREEAKKHAKKYLSCYLALRRLARQGRKARVSVHSVPLGKRVSVQDKPFSKSVLSDGKFNAKVKEAARALEAAEKGNYQLPRSDYACRDCQYADICRHRVQRRKGVEQ